MQLPPLGASGLVVFTPEPVTAHLEKWMRAYNPYHDQVAPHITVAYRGFVSANEWQTMRDQFARTIGAFRPFDVTLRTTDTFDGEEFVLWLVPEDDGSLLRLRAELERQFPQYFPPEPYPYVPHLSIGFFDSLDELDQAQATMRAEFTPLQFRVDAVSFVVFGETEIWGNVDRLGLGR